MGQQRLRAYPTPSSRAPSRTPSLSPPTRSSSVSTTSDSPSSFNEEPEEALVQRYDADSGAVCLWRLVFLHKIARRFIQDWEQRARRRLAEFRADTGHNQEDPAMADLVRELHQRSAEFAVFWNDHAVLAREGGALQKWPD